MNVAADIALKQPNKQTTKQLLKFLLQLLEIDNLSATSLDRLLQDATDNQPELLSEVGESIGLRLEKVALTATAAAEASAAQTPLVTRLADSRGWLVMYGFSGGKIRAAIVQGELIEQRHLKSDAVAKLLGLPDGRLGDWFLVQAIAPLANAVSHDHHAHMPPLARLIELMRADHQDLWLVLGLALGSGLLALASPVAVQALVNTVAMGGMGQPLLVLAIILFFFLAFAGAVHVLQSYLVEIIQRRIFVRLATDLAYRLPKVRREAFQKHHGAELVNRFFDVLTVQKAGSSLLLDGMSTAVQTLVGLVLLAFYHPFLLAFDVVLLLAIVSIIFLLGRRGVATAIQESISKYALVAWLESVATNLHSFKFNSGSDLAAKRTDALALAYLAAKQNHYHVLLRQIIGSVALYAIASTALLAIGGYLVIDGHLTLGQLVAAELIVSSALISLIKFGKHLEGYYDMMAGTDKIGHLLDLPLERDDGLTPELNGPVAVTVSDLSFGYNKHTIGSGFNLNLQACEKVAVLGGNSSGKTTLAEALCGLRVPMTGQITINDHNLNRLKLESLRRHIAVVGNLELIADSLFENVRMGRSELTKKDVEQTLSSIGFAIELVGGLDTSISTTGAPLSSTEARLIMLARAIIGQPGLLIVDGILDQLDTNTRSRIAPVLFAENSPWTLLVLSSSSEVAALCQRVQHIAQGERHD
jgi:putative ABC transport system ATP-binding protein